MKRLSAVAVFSCLLASKANALPNDWYALTQYQTPNMHYGGLGLHPYYKFSEVYDSNIYLVPRNQSSGQVAGVQSSWIAKNDLGLEANIPWRHLNNLSLGYDFESDVYTSAPSINDTINQMLHADFVREGARGMTYKAGDQYINTTDQASSELTQRARRWMNRAYVSADYAPKNGRLVAGVDADHETDKYLDPIYGSELNRYQEDAGFNVGYMLQPKTKAYVSYDREIIHYTVNPPPGVPEKDSKSHIVAIGAIGQLSPKIEGQVEIGLDYRQNDVAPVSGADRINRTPTILTQVTYHPDQSDDLILALSRTFQETIYVNNAFYYANVASLELDHRFPHRVKAGMNVALGKNQYLNAQAIGLGSISGNRRDDLYQGGAFIEYDIQAWLSTRLSYVYNERDSTFSAQFNYQDAQVAWNVSFKL
jgi:hypothetical protein